MVGGKDKNYKHGRKNQWRRWAWKEIAKRVDNRKKAKVLYLAGAKDLDRAVAVKKGFSPNNLYAVDNSEQVVKKLKRKGCLAIQGNAVDIIESAGDFFDVLFLDFCSGFTPDILRLIDIINSGGCSNGKVVLVNLQRGRDKWVKYVRGILAKYAGTFYEEYTDRSGLFYALMMFSKIVREGIDPNTKECGKVEKYIDAAGKLRPRFRSYKGNKVTMDTIVFTVSHIFREKEGRGLHRSSCGTRTLTALKAVSTMRSQGTLPPSPRY